MKNCPKCGKELSFPQAEIAEGQFHPNNIDAAKERYGYCEDCGSIALPDKEGHYGSLDIWGNWVCYHSCPACE